MITAGLEAAAKISAPKVKLGPPVPEHLKSKPKKVPKKYTLAFDGAEYDIESDHELSDADIYKEVEKIRKAEGRTTTADRGYQLRAAGEASVANREAEQKRLIATKKKKPAHEYTAGDPNATRLTNDEYHIKYEAGFMENLKNFAIAGEGDVQTRMHNQKARLDSLSDKATTIGKTLGGAVSGPAGEFTGGHLTGAVAGAITSVPQAVIDLTRKVSYGEELTPMEWLNIVTTFGAPVVGKGLSMAFKAAGKAIPKSVTSKLAQVAGSLKTKPKFDITPPPPQTLKESVSHLVKEFDADTKLVDQQLTKPPATLEEAVSHLDPKAPTPDLAKVADAPVTPKPKVEPTTVKSDSTGLANVVQDAEAEAGKLIESPRATGTKQADAHAQGKKAVEDGDIDPQTLAREIAEGKRTFKDETEVGALLEGKRRLLNAVSAARKKLDEVAAAGIKDQSLIDDYAKAQADLSEFVENVQAGKGKWSDVGRALQEGTTLDEGNFDDVLTEYARRRGVKPENLSTKEVDALKKQVADLNTALEEAKSAASKTVQTKVEEGFQRIVQRKARTKAERTIEHIKADKAAVRASLKEHLQKFKNPTVGSGFGAFNDALEAVPEMAKDLKKLIELHIEEIGINRLDKTFYESTRKMLRESMSDDEWAEFGVDASKISDKEITHLLADYYERSAGTEIVTRKNLAELKLQAKIMTKIEATFDDIILKYGAGKVTEDSATIMALKTGLKAQVKELMTKLGADAANNATRQRLRGILADLDGMIEGKPHRFKLKPEPKIDPPDIVDLKAQIKAKRGELAAKTKVPKTPRVVDTTEKLKATIADLEAQLEGKYRHIKDGPKPTKPLNDLQTAIKSLRRDINLEDKISDLEEQLRTGNLKGPSKRVTVSTREQAAKENKISFLKSQVKARVNAKKPMNPAVQAVADVSNIGKIITLGSDFGVVLRQGLFAATHPRAIAKGFKDAFGAMKSPEDLFKVEEKYRLMATEPMRKKAGLSTSSVLDPEEGAILGLIERFLGATVGKIPGMKNVPGTLGRGQSAYLNTIRRTIFDDFLTRHPDASLKELTDRADFINSAFGRSAAYGAKKQPHVAMQVIFTSPRYEASRWEMVGNYLASPATMAKAIKSPAARAKLVDMGGAAAGVYGLYKTLELTTGATVDWNPFSSDFMKVRQGKPVEVYNSDNEKQDFADAEAKAAELNGKDSKNFYVADGPAGGYQVRDLHNERVVDIGGGVTPRLRGALRAIMFFADPKGHTKYRKEDGKPYMKNEILAKEALGTVTRPITPLITGAVEERTGYGVTGWREDEGSPEGWERGLPLIMQGFKGDVEKSGMGHALVNAGVEFLGGSVQRYKKGATKPETGTEAKKAPAKKQRPTKPERPSR